MPRDNATSLLPAPRRFMTAAEYYALPEGPPYAQLIEGELIWSVTPTLFHQEILMNLLFGMNRPIKQAGLGVLVHGPLDVELDARNIFNPDIMFVSRDRLSITNEHGIKGAPDIVVEIIEKYTEQLDWGLKKAAYSRAGVEEFWAVLPDKKEVEIWHLAGSESEPAFRYGIADVLVSDLLPGWTMPVAEVFER